MAEYLAGVERAPLETIVCPMLLIQGNAALGGMLSEEDVAWARDILPQVQHVYLEQVGHGMGLFTGNTEPLIQAIIAFLDAIN